VDTLVCVKAIVPEPPRLRDEGGIPTFERPRSARLILNESDAYAVDQAVLIRKQHGGRVTAVTVGPLATQDALYTTLAKGADDALRVDSDTSDPLLVAEILAAVALKGSYDLVLTGIESWEGLASAVGPALAARLDRPFATAVCGLEISDDDRKAVVRREMGDGFFQTLEMTLPAVLSVQSGICPLSYPATMRVLQARRRPPRSLSVEALGVEPTTTTRLVAVSKPRSERETEMIQGPPDEIARALLDRIELALVAS
jgi:electron transfer flavoprotein beta subunit